jgi:hypothetical protein
MFNSAQRQEIIMIVATILKTKNLNSGYARYCCDLFSTDVVTDDSDSIAFQGNGTEATPLIGNLILSPDPTNTLQLSPSGLYAPGDGGSFYNDALAIAAIAAVMNGTELQYSGGQFEVNQIPFSKLTGVPGFLTSETDPVFGASPAASITNPDIAAWDTALSDILGLQADIDDLEAADIALAEDIADIDIVTAAFTGTTTKTLTLTKGDGSTVTADFTDTGVNDTLYATDGSISGPRVVNLQTFSIHWQNSGLFRITEGDLTTGATYDFNDGVDFLNYDAALSANIKQNSVTGIMLSVVDVPTVTLLSALEVTATGVKLTGVAEYTDNADAISNGLTEGYLYRTGDALKIVH